MYREGLFHGCRQSPSPCRGLRRRAEQPESAGAGIVLCWDGEFEVIAGKPSVGRTEIAANWGGMAAYPDRGVALESVPRE